MALSAVILTLRFLLSCGMWRHVGGYAGANASEESAASVFREEEYCILKIMAACFSEMLVHMYQITRRRVNLQSHRRENHKCRSVVTCLSDRNNIVLFSLSGANAQLGPGPSRS